MKFRSQKGFTLIELLVVVAIISLLSSVVLAMVNTARDKAKETQLVSFLLEVKTAMELYKNQTGHYPFGGFEVYNWADLYGVQEPSISGDFASQTFLSLIDLNTLKVSRIPKNTAVWISTNNLSDYSGYNYWGNIIVCSGQEKNVSSDSAYHDTYAIIANYKTSKGPLKSFKNGVYSWPSYGGPLTTGDFIDAGNDNWFSEKTACLNSN